jgi:hypothetical protein
VGTDIENDAGGIFDIRHWENPISEKISGLKGIVQRKLRWVKIGNNRQVMMLCWGAGHSFLNFNRFRSRIFEKKTFAAT